MNRRDFRKAQRRIIRAQVRHEPINVTGLRCPDCNSDLSLIEEMPGVYRGLMYHDASCPWLAQWERES